MSERSLPSCGLLAGTGLLFMAVDGSPPVRLSVRRCEFVAWLVPFDELQLGAKS
eukprot:SAG11_NODE_361_length_10183_cov_4.077053_8_plen_54_part_00